MTFRVLFVYGLLAGFFGTCWWTATLVTYVVSPLFADALVRGFQAAFVGVLILMLAAGWTLVSERTS